jgi:hypothetical protein
MTAATHVHTAACAAEAEAPATASPLRMAATRSGALTLLATLAATSVWVLVRNPLRTTVFPPCPLHGITGLWCPGCGATRASYLLLHGDVASAMHFNALWVVMSPLVLYQSIAFTGEAFGVRWLRRIPLTRPLIVFLLTLLLGFGVIRNLPFDAFRLLNPLGTS